MKRIVLGRLLIVVLVLGIFGVAWATNGMKTQFNSRYGTAGSAIDQCILCHARNTNPDIPSLETPQNPYGVALENNGVDFAAAEPVDSDGDGFTNIVEILARTFPGNPNSKPATTGTTLPIVDFDGDGKTDILWRHTTTGTVAIWLMNGTIVSSIGVPGAIPSDWQIKGVGDFDGDAKADVLWQHPATGTVAIWIMNGTTISSIGVPGAIPSDWQIMSSP